MDGSRFDALTKFVAGRPSRRQVLRALAGAAGGGLLARLAAAQQPPIKPGGPPTATAVPAQPTAPAETTATASAASPAPPQTVAATATAAPAPSAPAPTTAPPAPAALAPGRVCTATTAGGQLSLEFRTSVQDLTVVGKGRANLLGLDNELTLSVTRAGAAVLELDSTFTADGVFTSTARYGAMVTGAREATFTTRDGQHVTGSVDGRALAPFTAEEPALRLAGGVPAPQPTFPLALRSALQQLSAVVKGALTGCGGPAAAAPGALLAYSTRAVVALDPDDDPTYGSAPHGDDTGQSSACADCIGEAYAAAAGCGVACAASFGFACACVAGVALLFPNCHSPGTGLGQGCCPVACGPSQDVLGIGVVYQCCSSNDSCLDSANGECCGPGTQPCDGKICCPGDAPCRDLGICCPTAQNTCVTSKGPVCCNAGEDCMQGVCCPTGTSAVCDGTCCKSGEVCCGSTCCPSNLCLNGSCCEPPNQVCGGVCCGGFLSCCNNVCCAADATCVGGACCPGAQACGNVCCPAGQTCQDPSAGTCSGCSSGTTSVTCRNNTSGHPATTCCPPGVPCCNGQCCPFASDKFGPVICCIPVVSDGPPFTEGYGCHHAYACTS